MMRLTRENLKIYFYIKRVIMIDDFFMSYYFFIAMIKLNFSFVLFLKLKIYIILYLNKKEEYLLCFYYK